MRRFTFFMTLVGLGMLAASLSAQEAPPTVVRQVRAYYTEAARAAGIEGVVSLDAVVLADGSVGDVTVTKSLDTVYSLDQQAIDAVKQWQFKPATKDGKPVAVQVPVEIHFTLK